MSVSNFCDAAVGIQPGCAGAFTDITGLGAAVAVAGGDVMFGVSHAYGEDAPFVVGGKTNPYVVTFRYHYTEGAGETFELVRAIREGGCNRKLCGKWAPKGETAPNFVFTTTSGILTRFTYPAGSAADAAITMGEFDITCPGIDTSPAV